MREMKDSGVEWIGEIPSEWDISKVGYFFEVQLGKMLQPSQENHEDTLEYYLCAANVGKNVFKPSPLKQMWFNPNEYSVFDVRNGDLLVVEGGDVASCAIVNIDNPRVFIQNALHRVRSKDNSDIRILKYWLWNAKGIGYIDLICNKATIAHFSKEKFISLPYAVIPKLEQSKIADFLDRKCAKIDAVIEKTKATIEEYKKLKQSVITEAVTKGIRGDRPMKDSGIEWISEIASDWKMSRVGLHYNIILGKMLCDKQLQDNYTLEDYFCAANVHFDGVATQGLKRMWFSPAEKETYRVNSGDLLVVEGGAGAGGAAIVTELANPTYIQNSIMIVRCKCSQTNRYIRYWIECLVKKGYVDVVCNKATIPHFTKDKLASMPIPVMGETEMIEIADYLDEKCTEIDTLIAKKTALLDEMESYKKSVIYEYVTGKKEVC